MVYWANIDHTHLSKMLFCYSMQTAWGRYAMRIFLVHAHFAFCLHCWDSNQVLQSRFITLHCSCEKACAAYFPYAVCGQWHPTSPNVSSLQLCMLHFGEASSKKNWGPFAMILRAVYDEEDNAWLYGGHYNIRHLVSPSEDQPREHSAQSPTWRARHSGHQFDPQM